MTTIKIRETSFDTLFNRVLSVNYAENWECFDTTDKGKNPLVLFKTKQWVKLLSLIKDFTSKHKQDFTANLTEFDLEVGELIGIQYKIESEVLRK